MPIKYEPALLSLKELHASRDYALQCQVRAEKQRDELLAALHRLKTDFGKLANELHNAKGLYTAGEIKSIAGEMIRLFEPAHAAIAKAEGTQS